MLFEIPAFKNARPSRPDHRVRPKHSGPELAVSIEVPLDATSVEAVAAGSGRQSALSTFDSPPGAAAISGAINYLFIIYLFILACIHYVAGLLV